MIDLFLTLIEKPEKIRKTIVLLVKNVLIILFAVELYKWLIGDFQIIEIFDLNDWLEFILTGRILLTVFFYVLSYILLFQLATSVVDLLVLFVRYLIRKIKFKKPNREERHYHFITLSWLGIISYDSNTREISAGKRTEDVFEILNIFARIETKQEIQNIKKSLISDIVYIYFIAVFVFYSYTRIIPISNWFHIVVAFLGLVLPVIYVIAGNIMDWLHKYSNVLLFWVESLRVKRVVSETLLEYQLILFDVLNPKEVGFTKYVRLRGEEYLFEVFYSNRRVFSREIQKLYNKADSAGKKLIVVSNQLLTNTALEWSKNYKDKLIVLTYSDREDLVKKVEETFEEI